MHTSELLCVCGAGATVHFWAGIVFSKYADVVAHLGKIIKSGPRSIWLGDLGPREQQLHIHQTGEQIEFVLYDLPSMHVPVSNLRLVKI
jgi:hypothetical protein